MTPAETNADSFSNRHPFKDGSPVRLSLARPKDIEPLHRLYGIIVDAGNSFPHEQTPLDDEFQAYWFGGCGTVIASVYDRNRFNGPGRGLLCESKLARPGKSCRQRGIYRRAGMEGERPGPSPWKDYAGSCPFARLSERDFQPGVF